ncbi:immunoglobulin kappa light chain-like isoform X2 [Micropterus salmoides]|uniref:immunoglobulin kappa light chain-like isoform X2 n=1 Tax=Micropterus salmoides TaxID=27706 RepID=UPI0018EA4218|nr:immunoglobulin kappa light chain-like isoform X2 [Micropterus salmoides]
MGIEAEKVMVCLLIISLLWSVCEVRSSDIYQAALFQAVELGRSVTITCHINTAGRIRVWYKLNTGGRLQLVASTDTLYNLTTFNEQSNHHSVTSHSISSHLTISTTMWRDTGTYYCGVMNLNYIQFGQGTYLMIKGAKMISDSVVQQPQSQSVQPGDSVTLSCSVLTGHCAAEHVSVMWLKTSDHSAPEMIYSSGNKNDICQRTESGETTCVSNLLMRNLSSDDAGAYCCVVTLCGQILFGNGTRINIHNVAFTKSVDLSPTVIALILSNTVVGMVTLLLVWTLCKNHRKDPTTSDRSTEDSQNAVVYAAVCSEPRRSSCRPASPKYSQDTVVYSDVRSTKLTDT